MDEFVKVPEVVAAAKNCLTRTDDLLNLCIAVQQIPAPSLDETRRAEWIAQQFRDLGLADVKLDEARNVYGRIPGQTSEMALVVSAHSDTVFGLETDLTVKRDEAAGRVYGPGLGDNSTGVAALLMLAETLMGLPKPPVDIRLVANSGEEGIGDLIGMRAAMDALQSSVRASIVLEGMGLGRIVHRALGSRRYRIAVSAPGGHSWSDFGSASALHTLVQLAAELTHLRASESPRASFNIGRLQGGTSVNTIAQDAWLELDLRGETQEVLKDLIGQTLAIIARYQGPKWEQARRDRDRDGHRRPALRRYRGRSSAGPGRADRVVGGGLCREARSADQQHGLEHPVESRHTVRVCRRHRRRQRPSSTGVDSDRAAGPGPGARGLIDLVGCGVVGARRSGIDRTTDFVGVGQALSE